MTFTQEDKRDKIRSQLLFEITHPTTFYELSKKRKDKLECSLQLSANFPKKGSGMFYFSLILAERVAKELESRDKEQT